MRALIVDDDPCYRGFTRVVLQQCGYEVEEAACGADGLATLAARPTAFDLIVVDWHMEPMNGYSLVCSVRASPASRTLPIVVLTSETGQAHHRSAITAGADRCLTKPISAQALRDAVDAIRQASPAAKHPPVSPRLLDDVGAETWIELARQCVQQVESGAREIGAAVAGNEIEKTGRLAHRLAGTAALFELAELHGACRVLETAVRAAGLAGVAGASNGVMAAAATANEALRAQIARLGG